MDQLAALGAFYCSKPDPLDLQPPFTNEMRQLGDELPYAVTIQIERFENKNGVTHIDATIYVEKDGQKRIIIGKNGSRIKRVGIDARKDIEETLQGKVMLNTWVKVKASWSDDDRALKSLGYDDL